MYICSYAWLWEWPPTCIWVVAGCAVLRRFIQWMPQRNKMSVLFSSLPLCYQLHAFIHMHVHISYNTSLALVICVLRMCDRLNLFIFQSVNRHHKKGQGKRIKQHLAGQFISIYSAFVSNNLSMDFNTFQRREFSGLHIGWDIFQIMFGVRSPCLASCNKQFGVSSFILFSKQFQYHLDTSVVYFENDRFVFVCNKDDNNKAQWHGVN